MSGVEALRARIDKLSTEINMQTELLKKLRHEKSLVQRQLNAVLDPVARLPVEISSEIFLQSLIEPTPAMPHATLNICNSWTSIAYPLPPYGLRSISISRNHPLSLSLHGTFDRGIAATIWRHGSRLKHLEIREEEDDDDEDTNEDAEPMDLLGGMSPGPLPLLETLRIHGVPWRRGFPGPQILELLRQAPNLVECSFEQMWPVRNLDPTAEKLVHPTLRRLMFAQSDEDILHCLSLPALEPFPCRCPKPPLAVMLLGVLSTRRTQLQIIRINITGAASQRPAPDVFAAFRELVASGMQLSSIQACLRKVGLLDSARTSAPISKTRVKSDRQSTSHAASYGRAERQPSSTLHHARRGANKRSGRKQGKELDEVGEKRVSRAGAPSSCRNSSGHVVQPGFEPAPFSILMVSKLGRASTPARMPRSYTHKLWSLRCMTEIRLGAARSETDKGAAAHWIRMAKSAEPIGSRLDVEWSAT
ncbi:hypothetical protein B0H13DRAFT_2355596 [Mycena leptocephala]|nr:hypothetical protein B0H13DRAFT_2355596 [Mycena leptocephala]